MKPTTEILARISQNSLANKEEVFTKLYRYLLRPDIYFVAYKNLYANNGAATKGVNEDTADGFSEAKIDSIIKALADETYQPMPVRRTYIQKKNNRKKLRPLGIPTFTDKLVQEVLRMILEAVYEPIFLDVSHGFRPKRSCHTALKQLRREFNGTRWFVEGDIKGCFDNINHAVLVGLLNNKIKDARITKLIYKFLKAGYLENWQYHKTYSGTPQQRSAGLGAGVCCQRKRSTWFAAEGSLPGGAVCATTAIISTARKRDSSGRTRAGGGLRMEGIPMRSAGISTSDRERTGIREGALFSCRICRIYGVYGSPACWYAGLLYL